MITANEALKQAKEYRESASVDCTEFYRQIEEINASITYASKRGQMGIQVDYSRYCKAVIETLLLKGFIIVEENLINGKSYHIKWEFN